MKLIRVLPITFLFLNGCALLQGSSTGNDAIKGAQVALTAYADVYQPAVLAYGHLQLCGSVGATLICKDEKVLSKLKAADAEAVSAITAAQAVLEGKTLDTGQIAQAIAKIAAAESAIASSGALVKGK